MGLTAVNRPVSLRYVNESLGSAGFVVSPSSPFVVARYLPRRFQARLAPHRDDEGVFMRLYYSRRRRIDNIINYAATYRLSGCAQIEQLGLERYPSEPSWEDLE